MPVPLPECTDSKARSVSGVESASRSAGRRRLLVWRLPLPLLLALRYMRSARRDAFASFLSAVATGGIALGVCALILALAALSGLQEALRGEILARTAHLEVELPSEEQAAVARADLLDLPGVVGAQILVRGRGWLLAGGGTEAVELVGFDGHLPRSFPGVRGETPGLYVGDSLAARWGIHTGERVRLVSPKPTLTPLGPQPRVRSLTLAGTFRTGRTAEVERVALPLEVARTLVGSEQSYLEVTAAGLDEALALIPDVVGMLPPGCHVRSWRDLNRPLFFALRLEKTVMFVAVALIVLVAALALVADLALVIASKRPDLGMLRAMGADPRGLRDAFLLLGGLLGGVGAVMGTALGCGAAVLLDRYRLVGLPGKVYFLDYVPFSLQAGDLLGVLGLTALLACGSSYYVAQRVMGFDSVEALRR